MAVKNYNPKKVSCALGRHIVSGFADDSMISIEYAGDGTSVVVGADGEIVRSVTPNSLYTLKLALQQTSPTNVYLQSMYEKDREYGTGTFPVNAVDGWGRESFSGPTAWVTKPASLVRGKTQNNREWEIAVADGVFH